MQKKYPTRVDCAGVVECPLPRYCGVPARCSSTETPSDYAGDTPPSGSPQIREGSPSAYPPDTVLSPCRHTLAAGAGGNGMATRSPPERSLPLARGAFASAPTPTAPP